MASLTIDAKSIKSEGSPARISFGVTSPTIDDCEVRATRTVRTNAKVRLLIESPLRDRNGKVEVFLPRQSALRLIEEIASALNAED